MNLRLLPLIVLLLWCPKITSAQYDYLDIPLLINGKNSAVGWAGGLNAPQFSAVDLDNNGVEDLLVYDKASRICLTFLNNGTAGQVDYQYAPEYQNRFPQGTERFVKLRDFNQDGIQDLFFFTRPADYPNGTVGVLIGSYDSNNKIGFSPYDSTLTYDFGRQTDQILSFFDSDIPAIDDIDNDGDLDIIAFSDNPLYARNMSWYKNMSVENGNGGTTMELVLHHECWGMVTETGTNNNVFLSNSIDSCPDNIAWTKAPRHAGSTLTAIDYNGDGIKDMIMGDALINQLNMLTNSTVNDTFLVTSEDLSYPSYDTTVNILSFPTASFIDVNNDGVLDMLVSPNELGGGQAVTDSVVWYYQNTQTNNNIQLSFQQKDFLVGDMVDLGQDASPVFFDYNGDGLLDVLIGHYGYCQSDKTYQIGMTLLENIGTATQPSFELITKDYQNWSTLQKLGMHPTVGDLDGDGDQDLVVGLKDGTLLYIENTASSTTTAQWGTPILNYSMINIGEYAAPQLVDLDRDGDLDLAIGEWNGNINYFENTGTAITPVFSATPTTQGLGGIDVRVLATSSRRPSPCFFEIDGKFELILGHRTGDPIHYKGIDNNILGNYTKFDAAIEELRTGFFSDIDVADINNDGRLDMVIGNNRGGVSFFSVDTNLVAVRELANDYDNNTMRLYPNPATTQITLAFDRANEETLVVEVYNGVGQLVQEVTIAAYQKEHSFSLLPTLSTGIYFVKVANSTRQSAMLRIR
jgi:hypothetical protein